MELIAKTKDGVLIKATENEVAEIINSVTGKKPRELTIGDKIPAIDYAATITKVKTLANNYEFKKLIEYTRVFKDSVEKLNEVVIAAGEIDI